MKPKTRLSPITKLAILTTITCLAWLALELYRTFSKTPPPTVPKEVLAPLDPEINVQQLDSLKTRVNPPKTPLILPSPTTTPLLSPTESPPPTLSPTETPTPTPSPTP